MADTNIPDGAETHPGAGVQALIDRLKMEGVTAGKEEADRILSDAKAQADKIVADAEAKAKSLLDTAKAEAEREEAATRDGLKIAARDMVLSLRNELDRRIQDEAKRLIGVALADETFIEKLIIAVAGKAKDAADISPGDKMEIVLPERAVTFEELKQSPESVKPGTLTHFVLALAGDVLREGVTFSTAPGQQGISIKLTDKDISIDMNEETVAELLKAHLQPRLRAVMEGVLR